MKTFIQYLEARFQAASNVESINTSDLINSITLEARFQAASNVESINTSDLINSITSKANQSFGHENVESWHHNKGGGVVIRFGDRHFEMQIKNNHEGWNSDLNELPEIYISFNWDKRPEANSGKETNMYAVRQKLETDTMQFMHKIRDNIIRPLSHYAVVIYFIPASSRGVDSDRRERWYNSVLQSSGFKEMDGFWIPVNWGPNYINVEPGKIWSDD